jgi:hypothetical protein
MPVNVKFIYWQDIAGEFFSDQLLYVLPLANAAKGDRRV